MELLEREQFLADLHGWLASTVARSGKIAFIGGEAGIGKTALLHEFCIQQRTARVLWGGRVTLCSHRGLLPQFTTLRARPRAPCWRRSALERPVTESSAPR